MTLNLLSFTLLTLSLLSFSAISSTCTKTKYPIVLVHGLFGFDDVLDLDYFYRIPNSLNKDGAKMFIAAVSAADHSEVREEELLALLEYILELSGVSKTELDWP